jgi:hypothetical protein
VAENDEAIFSICHTWPRDVIGDVSTLKAVPRRLVAVYHILSKLHQAPRMYDSFLSNIHLYLKNTIRTSTNHWEKQAPSYACTTIKDLVPDFQRQQKPYSDERAGAQCHPFNRSPSPRQILQDLKQVV